MEEYSFLKGGHMRNEILKAKILAQIKRTKEILVFAIDVDGFLCEGEYWGEGEPTPIQENIDLVNDLSKSNFIVIHTARRHSMYEKTIRWLNKYGVDFHSIRMDKMPADVYLDDKSFNPTTNYWKDFWKEKK